MMQQHFQLFTYGTLTSPHRARETLRGAAMVGHAHVHGTLYDIAGEYPALMLYGDTRVDGKVWRCDVELLASIDEYENVASGMFRRIATHVTFDDGRDDNACWLYVAGPRLAHALTAEARIDDGKWNRTG
jgi:gamma-glutamylcyclotransferase (GGCT)/AIG2-like uncharacterized protein YtfP